MFLITQTRGKPDTENVHKKRLCLERANKEIVYFMEDVVEITSLQGLKEFVKKHGCIVLSEGYYKEQPDKENLLSIEIYNDYRE